MICSFISAGGLLAMVIDILGHGSHFLNNLAFLSLAIVLAVLIERKR
jgi:hypothetical protein